MIAPPVRVPLDAPIAASPNSRRELEKLLREHTAKAIARQRPDGDFEVAGRDLDVGDNTLGVVSLLAYQWHLDRDPALVGPARRGLDFHLAERIFRTDNAGTPYLRAKNSEEAHARYSLTPGVVPGGDWPTTVWALLHVVNTLRFGDGLITDEQRRKLVELGESYWRWSTEVTDFDPQDATNQAIACVIAGVQLGELLAADNEPQKGAAMRTEALRLYTEEIRPKRAYDRGYHYFQEHSGGMDQNYGAIALTFATEAYLVTGDPTIYADAEEHARYLNLRMSAGGFDYGGARHNEQRDNSPDVLGLRFWSNALGDDLGRYVTDSTRAFHMDTADGVPTGHFAFTTIWLMEHRQDWWERGRDENSRFKLRRGNTSVVFGGELTPYLLTAGGTEIIEAVEGNTRGIGPYRDKNGTMQMLRSAEARSTEYTDGPYATKVVENEKARTTYLTDGETLTIVSTVDAQGADGAGFLLGFPYLTGPGWKITAISCDGRITTVGAPDPSDCGEMTAGELTLTSPGGLRVYGPHIPAGADPMAYFNSPATIGMALEPYSLTVSKDFDPWGVPHADPGWASLRGTTVVRAKGLPNQLRTAYSIMVSMSTVPNSGAGFVPTDEDVAGVRRWFEEWDAHTVAKDLEKMADMALFPVNAVSDGTADRWDRGRFVKDMGAHLGGGDLKMESTRTPHFVNANLVFVITDATITVGEYSQVVRYGDLLVKTDGRWLYQTMVQGGF